MIEAYPDTQPDTTSSEPLRFAGVSYEWLAAEADAAAMQVLEPANEAPANPVQPFGIVDFAIEDERPKPVEADGGMTKVQDDTSRQESWNKTQTRLPNGTIQDDNQLHVTY